MPASTATAIFAAQLAFAERSKALVGADFVEAYVGTVGNPLIEADMLVRLCENVTGNSAKRSAARWLIACVSALRFERSLREGEASPGSKLASLADLQSRAQACGLSPKDQAAIHETLGRIGDMVEAQGKVTAQIRCDDQLFSGKAIEQDVMRASALALVNAVNKMLLS